MENSRSKVKRHGDRGYYDRDIIYSILDSAYLAHIAYVRDGYPVVIPTLFGRKGDTIFIHGASANGLINTLKNEGNYCLTVTLVDDLVLARSAFHHSMNYHSAVIFGKAFPVEDPAEKLEALKIISDQLIPGRWEEVRQPSDKELKITSVLRLNIEEASAKIRTGQVKDHAEDMNLPVWAGLVPLQSNYATPVQDPLQGTDIAISESIKKLY